METVPPSGKGGIRGEETLMAVIVMKAVGQLMLRSQNEEWFMVGDWGFVLMACEHNFIFLQPSNMCQTVTADNYSS